MKSQNLPGPFSKAEEVDLYMDTDENDSVKNQRLYIEVRYARKTCLSLKPSAAVFRLKQNYKNLENEQYAENLKSYLDSARSSTNLTIHDLKNVLHALKTSDTQDVITMSTNKETEKTIQIGSHVAAFWSNDFVEYQWHLAIVDKM